MAEMDPLDAFMADIDKTIEKQATESAPAKEDDPLNAFMASIDDIASKPTQKRAVVRHLCRSWAELTYD